MMLLGTILATLWPSVLTSVIYFNATIHTMDIDTPLAAAMCVSDQYFKAVGTLADVKNACSSAQVFGLPH